MQAWEEKIMEQNAAREEGHAAGLKEGLAQGGKQTLQELIKKKFKRDIQPKR